MNIREINEHANIYFLESQKAVSENKPEKVYKIARPILFFLSKFFIIPRKVRAILSHLVEIMDALHPLTENKDVSNISQG